MSGAEVLDLARDGVWTMLLVSGPLMIIALVVGLAVALLQALTQVQEMTLVFVPKIVAGRLVAFIVDSSPKFRDLVQRRQYAIHALPGAEDEEFLVSGEAIRCNDDAELRAEATVAMGLANGVSDHEILFEFAIDRALWTRWLDFGTPQHRPSREHWRA